MSGGGRRRSARLVPLAALLCACAGESERVVRLNGRIEAPTVELAAKVAGRVVEVLVREGQRVKQGEVLVRLDLGETRVAVERDRFALAAAEARLRDLEAGSRQPEIDAARAELRDREAALALADSSLRRQRLLREKNFGTERDRDQAETELERARAALRASRERLRLVEQGARPWQTEQARQEVERARSVLAQSETIAGEAELKAPADAVVLHRLAEPGLLLGAGRGALTLAFTERLYVRAFVPETRLGLVRPGVQATVAVDAFPGRSFAARVAEISPDAEFTPKQVETQAERVSLVYAAKVDLDQGWSAPLVPGQPAVVLIENPGPADRR